MNRSCIRSILVLVVTLYSFATHAKEPTTIQELLDHPLRPTLAQLQKALVPWPDKNPFQMEKYTHPLYISNAHNLAVIMIALTEMKFPGATHAFMGRDSSWAHDLFFAFYSYIGQPHRVKHLPISSGSLAVDKADIAQMMEGFSLDLSKADNHPRYVIYDRTSYSSTSQSHLLMKALFGQYAALHGSAAPLFEKLFFVDIDGNNHIQLETADIAKYVQSESRSAYPSHIFTIETGQGQHDLNQETVWHDSFKVLKKMGVQVVGMPGALSDKTSRQQILGELYQTQGKIQTPEFLEAVKNQARQLGYQFPIADNPQPKDLNGQIVEEPHPPLPPAKVLAVPYTKEAARERFEWIRKGDDGPPKEQAKTEMLEWLQDPASKAHLWKDWVDSKRLAETIALLQDKLDPTILREWHDLVEKIADGDRKPEHTTTLGICKRILGL